MWDWGGGVVCVRMVWMGVSMGCGGGEYINRADVTKQPASARQTSNKVLRATTTNLVASLGVNSPREN